MSVLPRPLVTAGQPNSRLSQTTLSFTPLCSSRLQPARAYLARGAQTTSFSKALDLGAPRMPEDFAAAGRRRTGLCNSLWIHRLQKTRKITVGAYGACFCRP